MCNVEDVTEDIRDILCRYKEKQQLDLLKTVNALRCCNCGHKSRIHGASIHNIGPRRMTFICQSSFILFSVLLIFGIMIAFFAYNGNFGGGDCNANILFDCNGCSVAF